MGRDEDRKRVSGWAIAAAVLLVSGYRSIDEFRYLTSGRTTEGRLLKAVEVEQKDRRGGRSRMLSVDYTFQDEARNTRIEHDLIAIDTKLPSDGPLAIQYIAGDASSSRLAGQPPSFWVVIFFVSLAVMALFLFKLAREANEPRGRKTIKRR